MDSILEEKTSQTKDYKPPSLKGPLLPVKRTFGKAPIKLKPIDEDDSIQVNQEEEASEAVSIQEKRDEEVHALTHAPKPDEIFEE